MTVATPALLLGEGHHHGVLAAFIHLNPLQQKGPSITLTREDAKTSRKRALPRYEAGYSFWDVSSSLPHPKAKALH